MTSRAASFSLVLCAALAAFACGGGDSAGPTISLVGAWDFIGFSDAGVQATTTGTVVFRADGTFSWNGTVTFPNEPTDSIVVSGTYQQTGNAVTLTIGSEPSTSWSTSVSGDMVVLTAAEPPPANTITLRRR